MKKQFKNIFSILTAREKRKFTGLVVLDTFVSLLDIVFLALLVFVVGFYTKTYGTDNLPGNISGLLNRYPLGLITGFFILFAAKNFLGFMLFRAQFRFMYEVASRISKNNMSAYLDGSFTDYVNVDSSIQVRKISQQPIEFSHYVLRGVHQVICSSILILLTIIPILLLNAKLFLLLFAILLPPVLLTAYITKKRLASLREKGKIYREKTIQYLQEALSGYIESNIYHRKEFFMSRYRHFQEKFNAGLSEHLVMQNLPSRLIEVFAVLGLFLLIVFNTWSQTPVGQPGSGAVPLVWIGGFIAAAYKIIPGIVRILNSAEQVKTYIFTVNDLLTKPQLSPDEVVQNEEPITEIEFSRINFGFKEDAILTDFSMSLQKGDFAGISGVSGRGKTTIINLLLGFLDPDKGWIAINDNTTTAHERQAYWSKISYIKQQSFFIHDSVRNNITLHEHYEKERLSRVIKVTGVDEITAEHPEGIETIVSENGKNISGGQRQRIILARALYKDANLIILDEPFNELDRVAEDRLLNHFRELASSGKIILLITHNPESLNFCNKIISLDE